MKRLPVAFAAVVAACVLVLAACGPGGHEADEAAIREINKAWQDKIVAKDAASIAQNYAEDAQFLPPNAPKAVGREAIQKGWSEMFAIPGVALTFESEKIVFAKSGDLAVDIATYKFSMGEGAAIVNDSGKSVVTWTKRDGKWQVLTDMFSSDLPAAPPPAPAAAPVPDVVPAPVDGATPPATPEGTTPAPATPATPAPATPPGTP
ncbi:MAG: SgcJ/EcaC family oxidoreductase [Alphaproteobacteria bacterium]|jgi:uncharacterized protein (TIGR02246 family)|nr:SgcJ/EcaC family oxidoreductase [Alphaproteobacteria bacterium]